MPLPLAKEVRRKGTGQHIMPMTAIICATAPCGDAPATPRAQLYFAGQSVLEYQARQARDVGAEHVIALVDAVTPALSRTVDRLMADGVRVQFVRDMPALMRDIPAGSDVLLFIDGAVTDQKRLLSLTENGGGALLVVEDNGTTPHLERIDGMHRWCGIGKIAADTVFATLDLIGDWELSSTLMRAAVQAGARRVAVSQNDILEGRTAIIDRQATADLVAQALLANDTSGASGDAGAEQYLFSPLARFLSAQLVRMQVPPQQLRLASVATSILAIAALYPGWAYACLSLLLLALVIDLAGDQMDVLARKSRGDGWFGLVPRGLILLSIALLAAHFTNGQSGLYLAGLTGVVQGVVYRQSASAPLKWAYFTPGSALVLLGAGLVIGQAAAMTGGAILAAIASVGYLLLHEAR